MTEALADDFGNASSVHAFGQKAKADLDLARGRVAALVGAEPNDLVWTAGGTEADNFAVRGIAEAFESRGRKHLVASAIEHEAVLNTCKHLARRGWTLTLVDPDREGLISPDALRQAVTSQTALVSVMHANNEIGTVQPIAELADVAHEAGAVFHTDAVQTVGKLEVDVEALGADLLSLSGHKFGGPKGTGALWIRRGTRIAPILTGGRHERNRRAGTENVPAVVGLGVAAVEARRDLAAHQRASDGCAVAWRPASSRASPVRWSMETRSGGCTTPPTSASSGSRPSRCSSRSILKASRCRPGRRARLERSSLPTCSRRCDCRQAARRALFGSASDPPIPRPKLTMYCGCCRP